MTGKKKGKVRIDSLLTEREFTESRNSAKALIMAGVVFVNGKRIDKAGALVNPSAEITIKGNPCPYVSRGGLKLEGVLDEFKLSVKDKIAVDIGASTGGFTDCLLQRGVKKVYAIDTGYGQLHWKLRNDNRVINLEKINARYLTEDIIPEKADLITIDVSFISIKKIIPSSLKLIKENGIVIALIKPQFEIGKGMVDKGGVIKSLEKHKIVLKDIVDFISQLEVDILGLTISKIKGQQGNVEFFILLKNSQKELKKKKFELLINNVLLRLNDKRV